MLRLRTLSALLALACTPLFAQTQTQDTTAAPPQQQTPAPVIRATPATAQHQGQDQDQQPAAEPATPPTGNMTPGEQPKPTGADKNNNADNDAPIRPEQIKNPVLWHDPGNISALNLYYGQGGEKGMPVAPFRFDEEDLNGTNPKFDATDANGKKWRVKLGNEARPEVAASRLLWAMGYYVNDDYVLPSAYVDGLKMKRGGGDIKNGHITDARFSRKPAGEKKIGVWEWAHNPFTGTREFNGLRVMMAVMNSWDLKDVNNAVYKEKGSDNQYFLVSDVGATFATTDFSLTKGRSKGNAKLYEKSRFITRATDAEVDFATPSKPTALLIATMGLKADEFSMRSGLVWIGRNIPRADAKWIGSMLGQLSHDQIVDAFRAGHFPPRDIDTYVKIVEERIAELKAL